MRSASGHKSISLTLKPWDLSSSGEWNRAQWRKKVSHDASTKAAAVGKKACLKQRDLVKKLNLYPYLLLIYACLKASIS